jgi:hypothetical protein
MSIERITLSQPCRILGIEQEFPKEFQEAILELVRRIQVNQDALMRDLQAQVVVDTSILPTLTQGSSTASTTQSVLTTTDSDDLAMESDYG